MKRRQNKLKEITTPSDVINNNGTSTEKNVQQKQKERILKDLKLERIKDNIKSLQHETLKQIDDQLSALMDSVVGELARYDGTDSEDTVFSGKAEPDKRGRNHDLEKRFLARASPLSELMEVRHIRSLYHMFIAALIIALISGAIGDALTGGIKAVRIGIRHVPTSFSHFDRAIFLWCIMFTTTCFIHPLLKIWNHIRSNISSKSVKWCFDRICIAFLIFFIGVVNRYVVHLMGDMAPASSAFVLMEQSRLIMKIHAFVRSNVVRSPSTPHFSKYLYFLFAPTLVYRDAYPRTSHIRWRSIGGFVVEFLGAILMLSCIVELHVLPEFSNFGLQPLTKGSLAALITRTVLPASLFTLCSFYLFLHAWLNAWAEVLCFADRRFYAAWWNATSYGEFYRTWNCVVHDYLHTYIYKDVRYSTGSSIAGKIAVFAASAIVHEYIIAVMLGFFYPIMFAQFFGIGAILGCVKAGAGNGRIANIFLWVSLAFGVGIQFSLYSMEAFSRINCSKINPDFNDYFIPRSWTCNGLDL